MPTTTATAESLTRTQKRVLKHVVAEPGLRSCTIAFDLSLKESTVGDAVHALWLAKLVLTCGTNVFPNHAPYTAFSNAKVCSYEPKESK